MSEGGRSNLINFDDNFLQASTDAVQTTITVQSTVNLPTVPFYLVIDPFNFENYEVLYCTNVAAAVLTVVRDLEGSKGGVHSVLDGIANIVRFAYAKQQLDDLWDAVEGVADNLTVSPYIFDSAITNTPAAGHWGRDNVDPTLATELFFNKTDEFGSSVTGLMGEVKAGDDIFIASRIQEGDFEKHVTTDVASLVGDVFVIPVEDGELTGVALTDQTPSKMTVLFGRSLALDGLVDVDVAGVEDLQVLGFKASTGEWVPITNTANKGITTLSYLYDANQDATPPSGDVSPDNATPSLTTNIAISNTDAVGDDIGFVLANIKAGDLLVLQQKADSANREDYTVVSNTDQGTFRDIAVTFDSAAGTINDNDPVFVHTLAQLPDLDAVYLRLDTTNDPLTGELSIGSNKIIALADGTADDDAVSKLQSETDAQFRANAEAIKRMQWRNVWAPGTYEEFDTVLDEAFTMVANKQTSDRAAPQPVGVPDFLLPDDGSNWDGTDPTFIGVVAGSNRYTFAVFGVLSQFRVYIPAGSDNTILYRGFLQDRTDPANILTTFSPQFTTDVTDDWIVINIAGSLFFPGTIFEVGLISSNEATGTDDTFQWNSLTTSNLLADPGAGNHQTNNADTSLRINDLDDVGGDRGAELAAVTVGSHITVTDAANSSAFTEYQVTFNTDNGGWHEFGVDIVATGLGGYSRGVLTDVRIQVPIAQSTVYVKGTAGWTQTPTGFTDVVGVLDLGGGGPAVSNDSFGTDIEVQGYLSSPDWDFLSSAGLAGGSGGGGGPAPNGLPAGGVAGDFLEKVDSTDFNSQWTDGDTVWLPLAGGTMAGAIDMGGFNLNNVGRIFTANGVEATPSHSFANFPDTGMYVDGGGGLKLARLGINRISIGSTSTVMNQAVNMDGNSFFGVSLITADAGVDLDLRDNASVVRVKLTAAANVDIFDEAGGVLARFGFGRVQIAGRLDMSTNQIENVVDPNDAQDAATKNYVDVNFAPITGGSYLPLTGGTLSGGLTLNGAGQALNVVADGNILVNIQNTGAAAASHGLKVDITTTDAATRIAYFRQANADKFVVFADGRVEVTAGVLDMNNNKIIDLTDPTANQDAATKFYVDDRLALYLPLSGGDMTGAIHMGVNLIDEISILEGRDTGTFVIRAGLGQQIELRENDQTTRLRVAQGGDLELKDETGAYFLRYRQPANTVQVSKTLDMQTNKIVGLADPTGGADQDAATKKYVDDLAGGTIDHNNLTNVTAAQHHAKYTDSEAISANTGIWLSLGGGTLTGDLSIVGDNHPTQFFVQATQAQAGYFFILKSLFADVAFDLRVGANSVLSTEGFNDPATTILSSGDVQTIRMSNGLTTVLGNLNLDARLDMGGFNINDAGLVTLDNLQLGGAIGAFKDDLGTNRVIYGSTRELEFYSFDGVERMSIDAAAIIVSTDLSMGSNDVLFPSNGVGIGIIGNNQGLSLELGQKNDVTVTPFIDFNTGGSGADYAARLIAVGDNLTATGGGGLNLFGSLGLKLQSGPLDMTGNDILDGGVNFASDYRFVGSTGAFKDGNGSNRLIVQSAASNGNMRFLKENGSTVWFKWDQGLGLVQIFDTLDMQGQNIEGVANLHLDAPGVNAIELGRTDGSASTPFIDFHSGAAAVDYDARIIASGGTGAVGAGILNYGARRHDFANEFAGTTVSVDGQIYSSGVDNSSRTARDVLHGTGVPDNSWGKDGDVYIRTSS